MRTAMLVLSILAMLANVFSTLIGVTMLMAGSPNSSPDQLLFIKRMMLAFGIVCLVCLVGAIILCVNRMFGWSIAVSFVPVAFAIVFFIWAFVREV